MTTQADPDTGSGDGRPQRRFSRSAAVQRMAAIDVRRAVLLTLAIGLLLSLILGGLLLTYYRLEVRHNLRLMEADKERTLRLVAQEVTRDLEAALSDLRYLAVTGALTAFFDNDGQAATDALTREFWTFVRQKRQYDQVRLLSLDGRERVRVNRTPTGARIVPTDELQDKKDRYYFPSIAALNAGEVYVSPLDLNMENGRIEQPPKPTIRFGVVLYDPAGRRRGFLVLNYAAASLLDAIRSLAGRERELWLLDPQGYWLMGPVADDEWGFMFPARRERGLASRHPLAWQEVSAQSAGTTTSGELVLKFRRIYPFEELPWDEATVALAQPVSANDYYWTVAAVLEPNGLKSTSAPLARRLAWLYALLVVFAFGVAAVLSYVFARNRALSRVFETTLDSLPLLVAYVDREQRFRFNNLAHERWWGTPVPSLYGRRIREVLGEGAFAAIRRHVEAALRGERADFEMHLEHSRIGPRDVSVGYLPDLAANGEIRGFYAVASDVTALKETERRERQRMLDLAQVSHLISMGEVATELAHQINQPLAAIAMYSAAALRTLRGNGEKTQVPGWLEAINEQAKRAAEVIQHLRRLLRRGETHAGPCDLNEIVQAVAAVSEQDAKARETEVSLRLEADLPAVHADRVLVEQAIGNLLQNALDVMASRTMPRRVQISTRRTAEQVCVEVLDSGPGVPDELGDRIFDSFVTDKPGRLGMGLTISRSIVDAHGGTVNYANRPGGGAVFTLCLPSVSP